MKILLIGEYSNVHATLARGLRRRDHDVVVASNGDFWKNYPRDIDLLRRPGRMGGLMLGARLLRELPRMRGFDVVQLINPMFIELKASRLFPVYNYLRRHNRAMVLGAFGMDYYWAHECTTTKPLKYSDFNIGDELRLDADALKERADWTGTDKERLNRLIAQDADHIVTGLYEYDVCYRPYFPEKTTFIPYPIEMPPLQCPNPRRGSSQEEPAPRRKIRLFIGISKGRSEYKGTDIMLRAAERVVARNQDKAELVKAEGLPFDEYQRLMDGSDLLLDQLYSYTPAMNALLAMSKGIVCVGGGEPENYEILCEEELRPIINVEPKEESVERALEWIVSNPGELSRLKSESRQYISRHHDYMKVAERYETLYNNILSTK